LADGIAIDFDNGNTISDNPPRIKALHAIQNPVVAGDSIFVFVVLKTSITMLSNTIGNLMAYHLSQMKNYPLKHLMKLEIIV